MSGVVAFIRRCLAVGMDHETALLAAEQFEEAPPISAGALRQRRYRAKASLPSPVTPSDAGDAPSSKAKSPPTPLQKTQTLSQPPSPPTGAHGSAENGFEAAWRACTEAMRKRAGSKSRTEEEWRRASRTTGEPDLLAALRRYLKSDPDVSRTGGPSFLRWLRDGKWEAWLAGHDPPEVVTPDIAEWRVSHLRETGEWKAEWGPRPKEIAA